MSVQSQSFSNQTTYDALTLPADSSSLSFSFSSGLPVGASALIVTTDGMVSMPDVTLTLHRFAQDGTVLGQQDLTSDNLISTLGNTYIYQVDPSWFTGSTVLAATSGTLTGFGSELLTASLDYLASGVALSLDYASESGASTSDGVINVTHPVFSGTAEAGASVALWDGEASLGTTTADGSGAWSITSAALADGSHAITATEMDASGLSAAASTAVQVVIDTAAPGAPSTPALAAASDTGAVGDQLTSVSNPILAGQAEAGSTVVLRDDVDVIGSGTADGSGAWSIQVSGLAEGDHTITASATDLAGNSGTASSAFVFTVDGTAPSVPSLLALAPASDSGVSGDGITNVARPVFRGMAEAGSTVRLYNGAELIGTGVASSITGAFAIAAIEDLSAGSNTITATATDLAGNTSQGADAAVTFDAVPPPLTLALANDTGASATDRVTRDATLSGTADPNGTVTLTEGGALLGTATADGSGAWTFSPVLDGGTHSVTASSTDTAGNASSSPLVFTLDASTDSNRFAIVDTGVPGNGTASSGAYSGPVTYLDWQYINSSSGGTVIASSAPNAFIHTGAGDDAIAASGGSNVLDGDAGSNFLVGASGVDGGADTFFLDGRGGSVTWDTVVNFHQGDAITLWGFTGASSLSWADNEGAAGYEGATVHAELGGAGTGINASLTLAGMSLTDAQAHLQASTGTTGGVDYMYLHYV